LVTVIAGPLSRFFAKDEDDAVRLRAGVEVWRQDLVSSVAEKVGTQLEWDESSDTQFEGDLGESGWIALRMFAFYAERSDLDWPDTVPALPEFDTVWREAAEDKFSKSLYGQLLACEMWLPGAFPVTIRAPRPDGETSEIGSIQILADQLLWLNQRTFQADAEEIAEWQVMPADAGGSFLKAARRGFAALSRAVAVAQKAAVPLVLRQ
tara:strand:+ start:274 stop:897 length:624 start_codon:yes stop_codon:yes gene_type:complete